MPKQGMGVIPIRRDTRLSDADREVADLAFSLWLATGFRGVSPEENLFTAVREMRGKTPAGLFLVPTPKSQIHLVAPPPDQKGGVSPPDRPMADRQKAIRYEKAALSRTKSHYLRN